MGRGRRGGGGEALPEPLAGREPCRPAQARQNKKPEGERRGAGEEEQREDIVVGEGGEEEEGDGDMEATRNKEGKGDRMEGEDEMMQDSVEVEKKGNNQQGEVADEGRRNDNINARRTILKPPSVMVVVSATRMSEEERGYEGPPLRPTYLFYVTVHHKYV